MMTRPRVGLLGGTFDPIHLGHLAVARVAQQSLHLDAVRFIPSARPPHRADSPHASGYDRLEMIRLAIADQADGSATGWHASDLELRREGSSYSVDTLRAMHAEGLSPLQIFFLTGADAFAEVATWHRYPEVLDASHFVVVTRPGSSLEDVRRRLPSLAARMIAPSDVAHAATPHVVLLEARTPDVSSTDVRQRAARGESLAGLVTPSVAAYISDKFLYRTEAGAPVAPVPPGA